MNPARTLRLIGKDLKMGPHSPMVLYAIVLPVVMTLLVNVVFGSLFDPKPRLGIFDQGKSTISRETRKLDGIQVTFIDSAKELKSLVTENDLDAGLILQPGFDEAVRRGDRPDLNFFVGGESLASNRIILSVTAFNMIRGVAGSESPIEVEIATVGDGAGVPINSRLLPMLVMLAILVAGVFAPAAGLVEEREHNTLNAVLVTPAQMPDVLVAKAMVGFLLAMATAVMTLMLNNAFTAQPAALLAILTLGALMAAEIGLLLGSWAKDSNMLFTAGKGINFFLMMPVFFYVWPGLPQWIPKLMPTYYFLSPLYQVAIEDASLADVAPELAIGLGICALLFPVVLSMGRRMEGILAAE